MYDKDILFQYCLYYNIWHSKSSIKYIYFSIGIKTCLSVGSFHKAKLYRAFQKKFMM